MLPIAELKRRLWAQRQALLRQVASAEAEQRWLATNVEPEQVEEGQEENLARLLARLDDMGIAEIEAIDQALARIVSGEYGGCVSCGEAIPVARLEALPAASECLPCAKRHARPR
jgi:RNA polymerase-binding transcription factor DksA